MEIIIMELDQVNLKDVNRCDGAFTVDSITEISIEDGIIKSTTGNVSPYEKSYPIEEIDFPSYIGNPDKAVFLAYVDDQVAGQIRLRRNWNAYAYVEDIVVDRKFRKIGVGRLLIQGAIRWAEEKRLPGVMLETQNNNLAACRLYESCGFKLGGFDRFLYQGLRPGTDEIALYWYWIPEV